MARCRHPGSGPATGRRHGPAEPRWNPPVAGPKSVGGCSPRRSPPAWTGPCRRSGGNKFGFHFRRWSGIGRWSRTKTGPSSRCSRCRSAGPPCPQTRLYNPGHSLRSDGRYSRKNTRPPGDRGAFPGRPPQPRRWPWPAQRGRSSSSRCRARYRKWERAHCPNLSAWRPLQ